MVPLYRQVFKDAWWVLSSHKKLAWFGLLASFIGTASVFEVLMKAFYKLRMDFAPEAALSYAWAAAAGETLGDPEKITALVIGIFITGLAAAGVALYFFVSAQGTLVLAAARFEKHKGVKYKEAWRDSRKRFAPMLAVNALKGLLIIAFFLLMSAPIRSLLEPPLGVGKTLLNILLVVILLAFLLIVSYVALFAVMYIMVKNMGLHDSLVNAVKLFFSHWLASFEIGFVVFVFEIMATTLTFICLLILALPVIFFGLFGFVLSVNSLTVSAALAGVLAFGIIMFSIRAAYTTFATSVWTSLFLHMTRGAIKSRILQWIKV